MRNEAQTESEAGDIFHKSKELQSTYRESITVPRPAKAGALREIWAEFF